MTGSGTIVEIATVIEIMIKNVIGIMIETVIRIMIETVSEIVSEIVIGITVTDIVTETEIDIETVIDIPIDITVGLEMVIHNVMIVITAVAEPNTKPHAVQDPRKVDLDLHPGTRNTIIIEPPRRTCSHRLLH